ncbi:endonuclease/exonuclease/phosphatase family protein [Deminuibacter soli]|uniref:Endonuclease n=1 Tax=Deminuibacter soli TaxID=2291815 RepID=A0A3E1NGB8_9BACT|nr:endonuclease/exonuclease/phosphatase family protein [Deminuibacter soli]RFM27010.1 endonuclease [Deminuibacter soli]
MRTVSSLLLCLLLSAAATAQIKLRILSYNIYHAEQNYEHGKPSLNDIAALIQALKPDFVACQEVDSATERSAKIYGKPVDIMQELAKQTGMKGYFGKAMNYGGGGYGEGVLTKYASDKPTVVQLPNPSGGEPRALIYVQHQLADGRTLYFGGTHLCHQFAPNREAQVQTITSTLGNAAGPAILCGDFNIAPEGNAYELMLQHWLDAAVVKGDAQNTFSFDKPHVRIDYAFLSKNAQWKVTGVEVLPYKYSDHMPVLFTIELL